MPNYVVISIGHAAIKINDEHMQNKRDNFFFLKPSNNINFLDSYLHSETLP